MSINNLKLYSLGLITLIAALLPAPSAIGGLSPQNIAIGWPQFPETWDPRLPLADSHRPLVELIHCSLISLNQSGGLIGDLAEKWHWENPLSLTFVLKGGAKFNDGTPVSPQDIKSTLEFMANTNRDRFPIDLGLWAQIKSIETSPTSITINLRSAYPDILPELDIPILPSSFFLAKLPVDHLQIPGCGPYQIESASADTINLRRNSFFTLAAPPNPISITIHKSQDILKALAAVASTQIGILFGDIDPMAAIDFTAKHPNTRIIRQPPAATTIVGFNLRDRRLSDARVRRAISLSVDRHALIKHVLRGFAEPGVSLLSRGHPYFSEQRQNDQVDLITAKRLLDEAGLKSPTPGGLRLEITLKTILEPREITIAKAIAGDLRKIGIAVQVQPISRNRFEDDIRTDSTHLWLTDLPSLNAKALYAGLVGQSQSTGNELDPPPPYYYKNAEGKRLLDQLAGNVAPVQQRQIFARIQQMMADDLPILPLWHAHTLVIAQKGVQELNLFANGSLRSLLYLQSSW